MLDEVLELDALDHLADGGVGRDQHGVAVLLRQLEGGGHHVAVFLHGGRRQHDRAVVAVAAAAGHLPVVALSLRDVAETGADAHDVDDDRRKIRRDQIGDALLIQREAGACGAGQRARAGSRRAEEHVDARELGLGLHERAADLIHALGQILEDLGLRGDGIAAVKPAAGAQRRFCQGLIALHQLFAHVCTSYSRISKTLSGHTR